MNIEILPSNFEYGSGRSNYDDYLINIKKFKPGTIIFDLTTHQLKTGSRAVSNGYGLNIKGPILASKLLDKIEEKDGVYIGIKHTVTNFKIIDGKLIFDREMPIEDDRVLSIT